MYRECYGKDVDFHAIFARTGHVCMEGNVRVDVIP